MLVAFLYDLMMRKESGGKRTLADRYRDLFSGRVADGADGNEAIIAVLGSAPAMSGFIKHTLKAVQARTRTGSAGLWIHVGFAGKRSQLRVSRDLNDEQKQLLRSLGYRD